MNDIGKFEIGYWFLLYRAAPVMRVIYKCIKEQEDNMSNNESILKIPDKKLGFGLMRLPVIDDDIKNIDQDQFNKMADAFIDAGFSYFDTAYPYHWGKSEAALRKAVVERYPRDAFLLADKMPTFLVNRTEDYEKFFKRQVERCGVDRFDFYLLHMLGEDVYEKTEQLGGFDFVKRLKKEGKAEHIGFSYHVGGKIMSKGRIFITLCALGAAGGSIYIIPYIKYVFYDQQLNVMGISNAQSGLLLTVFAITAIVLFIPGGLMAGECNALCVNPSGSTTEFLKNN